VTSNRKHLCGDFVRLFAIHPHTAPAAIAPGNGYVTTEKDLKMTWKQTDVPAGLEHKLVCLSLTDSQ